MTSPRHTARRPVWRPLPFAAIVSAALIATVAACGGSDDGVPAPVVVDPVPPAAKAADVRLLAFNDFHGNLEPTGLNLVLPDPADATKTLRVNAGGGAYLAAKLAELRAQQTHTFVISSGDAIGASPLVSSFFRDEPTVELMNAMKVDLNAVGNHEFDKGVAELSRIVRGGCSTDTSNPNLGSCASASKGFTGAKFGLLAGNVVDAAGKPIYPPYAVRQFGEQKLGIVGVVTRTTPTIVSPAGVAGLRFLDEAETINKYVAELKTLGVKAVVAVVHEGGQTDSTWNDTACANARGEIFTIADKLDKASVGAVFSGHTHQGYNCVRNGIRVMQAFAFGRGISQVDLTIKADGTIDASSVRAVNVPVVNDTNTDAAVVAKFPALKPDAEAKKIVDEYAALAKSRADRDVGQITGLIDRTAAAGGDTPAGRLIADAQLAATKPADKGGAVVAFMNPGGVRADFTCPAYPCTVTYGAAFTVQPFGNSLVVTTLTGAQIKSMLEDQFRGANAERPRILQPSAGFGYTWSASAAPGSKVSDIKLGGVAIDPAASYRVTVNSFLSDGGDGFTTLLAGASKLGGAQDIDALIDYFAANRPTAPMTAARITRVN